MQDISPAYRCNYVQNLIIDKENKVNDMAIPAYRCNHGKNAAVVSRTLGSCRTVIKVHGF
jgi:hypothetical protein